MHWILAITNACNGLTYVTRFSCDIFGFYVAFIYLQKGIQVLTRQWALAGETSAFVAVMVSLLVLGFGYGCGIVGESSLFQRYVRKFIEDYGTPLTIVFFTGFVHLGYMKTVHVETLPTSKAFFPTTDRGWFIHFWDISVGDVFLAIPFAILLTILFYFDHNGTWLFHLISIPRPLTRPNSIIPDCPRQRISPPQATRVPLGYLPPRPYNWCRRSPWYSLSQWSHPAGSIPHQLTLRHTPGS